MTPAETPIMDLALQYVLVSIFKLRRSDVEVPIMYLARRWVLLSIYEMLVVQLRSQGVSLARTHISPHLLQISKQIHDEHENNKIQAQQLTPTKQVLTTLPCTNTSSTGNTGSRKINAASVTSSNDISKNLYNLCSSLGQRHPKADPGRPHNSSKVVQSQSKEVPKSS